MIDRWRAQKVWIQWAFYFPVIVFLAFVAGLSVAIVNGFLTSAGSVVHQFASLIQTAVGTLVFFWGAVNFAPKAGKELGWLFFALLTIYVLISIVGLLRGKTIFGDELPSQLSALWMLQNVIWFGVGAATMVYLSKKINH